MKKENHFSNGTMPFLTYLNLIKLGIPFFELIQGKLYDCQVEHKGGIKMASIIPLAFEEGKNRQFVITEARRLFGENAAFVHDIIQKRFDYFWRDGIFSDYPLAADLCALTIPCTTQRDGTLLDYNEARYFDFTLTTVI